MDNKGANPLELAAAALERQNLPEAEALAHRAVNAAPAQPEAFHLLADILYRRGQTDNAIGAMLRAIERDLGNPHRWDLLATLLRSKESPGAAVAALRKAILTSQAPEALVEEIFALSLLLLGFEANSGKTHLTLLYEQLALPGLLWALETDRIDLALSLEQQIYETYVKPFETNEHFSQCFSAWATQMCRAGARNKIQAKITARSSSRTRPLVALIQHNNVILAHTEVALSMLKGATESPNRTVDFIFYCLSEAPGAMQLSEDLSQMGVQLVCVAGTGRSDVLNRLQSDLQDKQVSAAVWLSNTLMMSYAFGIRIAPVQAWWAMRYHALELPEIDLYIGNGSYERFRTIEKREWRIVHGALRNLYQPEFESTAAQIRAQFGDKLILGCMGREEKLNHQQYLATIAEILKKRDETIFVWTGRKELQSVTAFFASQGLANRHQFVGWIDTKLYAQVIDIYLDTFPLGGGHTVFQSMAAGAPVSMLDTPENRETGVPMHITPIVDGTTGTSEDTASVREIFQMDADPLLLVASDQAEYLATALRLIDDTEFRAAAGAAGRKFVEKHMMDCKRLAASFEEHLRAGLDQYHATQRT